MLGRPRSVTDQAILGATSRAISRFGPARLTLATIAAEAGIAPATLIQRFGSKRNLLLAFSAQAAAGVTQTFSAARAGEDSPLRSLRAALLRMAAGIATADELAHHLAFLEMELSDPDFHSRTLTHAAGVRAEIRTLLDEAVAVAELPRCDTIQLARTIQVTYNGALLTWAIFRDGSLADWLGRELDSLIGYVRNLRIS